MRVQKNFIREKKLKRKRDCRVTLGQSGLRVRAVRVPLSGGETETLITNVGEEQVGYTKTG
jgi:hypothetical protein